MGAVGLNGAARAEGETQASTARIASSGWAKWAPVSAAAVCTHLVGSSGRSPSREHDPPDVGGQGRDRASVTMGAGGRYAER